MWILSKSDADTSKSDTDISRGYFPRWCEDRIAHGARLSGVLHRGRPQELGHGCR